jgi:hypothetical protein
MHWKTAIRMLASASLLPSGVVRRLGSAFSLLTASLIHRQISRKFAGLVEYGSSCSGVYLARRSLHAMGTSEDDRRRHGAIGLERTLRSRRRSTVCTGISGGVALM